MISQLSSCGENTAFLSDADPVASFAAEIQAAVEGVRANRLPDLLSAELARDALLLCHKECQSVKTGAAVDV